MTDKDLNDMTASEMLRWSANYIMYYRWGNPWNKLAIAILGLDPEKARAQEVHVTDAFSRLADKIDAELAQARELSLRQGAELWAKANGWPDFKQGEDFGAWLERCALKLPCDKDGEPWSIGDRVMPGNRSESTVTGYDFDGNEWFLKYRWCGIDSYANEFATSCKRPAPAPEVLGADLLPIKVGETVYRTDAPITEAVVTGFRGYDDGSIDVVCSEKGGKVTAFYSPSLLTHTPSDTQERIDEDARKNSIRYWGCEDFSCDECPALIDGKKPVAFYELDLVRDSCSEAQKLDLLRRQRELDARKGGAE